MKWVQCMGNTKNNLQKNVCHCAGENQLHFCEIK